MIKKAQLTIDFDLDNKNQTTDNGESTLPPTKLDFLPCNFKDGAIIGSGKDNEEINGENNQRAFKCNRDVFFDPCIEKKNVGKN